MATMAKFAAAKTAAGAPARGKHLGGGKPKGPRPAHGGAPGRQCPGKAPHKAGKGAKAPSSDSEASAAVTGLVERMREKSLVWYQALKPLKTEAEDAAAAATAPGKKNQKKTKTTAPAASTTDPGLPANDEKVVALKARAQRLLEAEVARFEARKSGKLSSDDKYLATMMSKGTLADRVAALTLTIQSSPFHSLTRLAQLISMASKKARRESMMAVESLKDLFINNLLPDDRRLRFFHQNPVTHPGATDAHLVLWFYEHCLKTAFAQLVGVLASGMDDAVDNHKRACIRGATALLAAKPEQEAVLLGMLVNKLGDPDRKVASLLHKTLQDLLQEHPLMKRVVVDEVERLLTRPKVSDRAKYNAILFLNQLYLRKGDDDDSALAGHLISVYFALFSKEVHGVEAAAEAEKQRLQRKAQKTKNRAKAAAAAGVEAAMDRKLLSALLVGVNRAFPYAKNATSADLTKEIDTLFKVVRLARHFPTSVQALMLLFQVMNATNSVSDRFYTALYEKLVDPRLRETSKHTLFLNLMFKAMKADVSPARTSAMIKRLLQLTSVMTPAFTCAVLFLLSEVVKVKPQLRTLFDQPEAGGSVGAMGDGGGDEEHFTDQDKLNVFQPGDEKESDDEDDNDDKDDEMDDDDAPQDGLTDAERTQKVLAEMFGAAPEASTPEMPRAATNFEEPTATEAKSSDAGYDWRKRNPLYAGAETSCAWEIHHLLCHYHPSVQMFARQLVTGNGGRGIEYAGDPLVDFTLHAFFEKFMNKKPRHKQAQAGAAAGAGEAKPKSWTFVPINTEAVLKETQENIDATDQFFYKFFKERAEREKAHPSRKRAKKARHDDEDRTGDVFSDDDEEEDEEMEAFAQQLAEGIMQDGDMDDEDPDMGDWSGPEDDDDDEDGPDGDDDDEAMAFGDEDEDDEEDDAALDGEMDGGAFGDDDDDDVEDDDDDDDEDGFDFAAMDGDLDLGDDEDDDDEDEPRPSKNKKVPPSNKRKSMFASADDLDEIMREAEEKQRQQELKRKKRKEQQGSQQHHTSTGSKPKKPRRK